MCVMSPHVCGIFTKGLHLTLHVYEHVLSVHQYVHIFACENNEAYKFALGLFPRNWNVNATVWLFFACWYHFLSLSVFLSISCYFLIKFCREWLSEPLLYVTMWNEIYYFYATRTLSFTRKPFLRVKILS